MKKLIASLIFVPAVAAAQGTPADYARAKDLRARYEALALNVPGTAAWSDDSSQFWYRRTVKGGHEFVAFDVATRQKRPPFDHTRVAAGLSAAIGHSVSAQSSFQYLHVR